ncbi:hypothetical protein SteCoe_30735 [Stentor coeruleus]|uniref:Acyl-CoA dehydrogenase n=1 Tax=Stentor coeruleus TaxID=5963 RepID=A0A1R2B2W5_9CILI|nr:hypothetical protein SteCoe_30735 [Stentor coeruleus]
MIRNLVRKTSNLMSGNWDLNVHEQQIQDMALKFSNKELAPKANEWDRDSIFPRDLIKSTAELGFGGMYCSGTYGGSELSRLESSLIYEALSKGCVSFSVYLSVHNMVAWIIDTFADENLKEKYLPGMFAFDKFGAYCLTEPSSGSDAASMRTVAVLEGDYYTINGSKMFITGGAAADVMALMCKTGPKEISCIIVEGNTPGVHFSKNEEKLGWNLHPTNLVSFDNVKIHKSNLVGKPGIGMKIALQGLEGGRINIASCGLGGAWFALEKARDYMENRVQFGSKLSEFQYLRFKMAEAFTKLTTSRVLVRHAAHMVDTKNTDKIPLSSMAKLVATDYCFEIVDMALQMHGGMGVIKSTGIERVFRDLRILKIVEGTNEIMRLIISRSLFHS